MRITNKAHLPQALVNAIENDPYDRGDCYISATQLIGPPQIRYLQNKFGGQIEEDASDRIWALLGQSIHTILERHGAVSPDTLEEWRMSSTYADQVVSGQIDLLDVDGKIIWDFKLTSVWAVINGVKPEWEAQLNVLADIVRRNGGEVESLKICALLRDWSKMQVLSRGNGYPKSQVKVLEVPLWSEERAQRYILDRLSLHLSADQGIVSPCTDEERWTDPDKWAVMKKGRKSAIRVLPSMQEAGQYIADNYPDGAKDISIDHRKACGTKRCDSYCAVAPFCAQYADLKKEAEDVG